MGRFRILALLVLPALCFMVPTARADAEFRKAANLMVLSEVLLTQSKIIGGKFGRDVSEAVWQSNFSDRLWSAQLSGMVAGKESELSLTGFAWDGERESFIVAFSGTGKVGGEPVLIQGNATWIYDQELKDYRSMDFRQVTRFGTGTEWVWSNGTETIVGGTLGQAIGVGLMILMGNKSPRDHVRAMQIGGAIGKDLLVSLSNLATGKGNGSALPDPPAMPTRPAPQQDAKIVPSENTVIVALTGDNLVIGDANNGEHILKGRYSLGAGQATGSVMARDRIPHQ